jgi:hypothetical protein
MDIRARAPKDTEEANCRESAIPDFSYVRLVFTLVSTGRRGISDNPKLKDSDRVLQEI